MREVQTDMLAAAARDKINSGTGVKRKVSLKQDTVAKLHRAAEAQHSR